MLYSSDVGYVTVKAMLYMYSSHPHELTVLRHAMLCPTFVTYAVQWYTRIG